LYRNNFYITQSYYNLITLQYIQQTLTVGHITYTKTDGTRYQVQNVSELIDVIIPILDYYPLFTWRYARYLIFKESLMVRNVSFFQDKTQLMELKHLLNLTMTDPSYDSYIAPTFDTKKPSKSWIVGFVEAEGTFGIKKKRNNFYDHYFYLPQTKDMHLLQFIKETLGITTKINLNKNTNCHYLLTTNKSNIEFIISYFDSCLVGPKAVEFIMWKESYFKYRLTNQHINIYETQQQMQELRRTHLNHFKHSIHTNLLKPSDC